MDLNDRYLIIDRNTGEPVDVAMFVEQSSKGGWEKAYVKVLAAYMQVTGSATTKLLAYLIRTKNNDNMIIGSMKQISDASGVSIQTVKKIFKKLQEEKYIKKLQNGLYMLTPHMLRYGSSTKGVMLLHTWDELNK